MTSFISPNSKLIEVIVTPSSGSTLSKYNFGTEQDLQGKKIVAIEAFSDQDMIGSPISGGTSLIPIGVFKVSWLTLYRASVPAKDGYPAQNEGLYYDQVPLPRLRNVNNYVNDTNLATSSSNTLFRIMPAEMSWTKCYITCQPTASISSTYSAVFLVHYLNENQNWRPYMPQ